MSKISASLRWLLYYGVAYYMPKSNSRLSLGSKAIRSFLVKGFIEDAGTNINVQRKVTMGRRVRIGNNSGIGIGSVIQGNVSIGCNVMMGPECFIYTQNHSHKRTDIPMIQQGYEEEKPVIIGDDVWIGSRVTILPGVKIGRGVVIGAGSVVTKDFPDYVVIGGNPAKVLKRRTSNSDDSVEK